MEKSGIKSFIFSFVLTLSAVLLVDKMLPATQKEVSPVKKISYKNIALFSDKKDDLTVASASFSPTKNQEQENIIINHEIREENASKEEKIFQSEETVASSATYDEIEVKLDKEISEEKNIDVVFDPNKTINNTAPEEYTFEELMAMNNVENIDDYTQVSENNTNEKTENGVLEIADTTFDENLNLWLPIEKGETKIDLAESSDFSQVAMSDSSVMLSSVIEKDKAKVETLDDAIAVAKTAGNEKENSQESSPWIVAKGAKYAKNRQGISNVQNKQNEAENKKSFAVNKISDGSEARAVSGILNKYPKKPDGSVDVAYKVMDNLIIPIPEEILEDDNLTPQLVASDSDTDDSDKETKKTKKKGTKKEKASKADEKTKRKKSTLFESIGSFFNSTKSKKKLSEDIKEYDFDDEEDEDEEDEEESPVEKVKKTASKIKKKIENYGKNQDIPEFSEILPTEMKLSFQPEKAEISGSTLRWIRAFAENTKKNPDTYIEVRIDGSGAYALQQRRLNLLQGIFFENGVKPEKINTIFTAREPNSFVIRSIRIIEEKTKTEKKKEKRPYYQMW